MVDLSEGTELTPALETLAIDAATVLVSPWLPGMLAEAISKLSARREN